VEKNIYDEIAKVAHDLYERSGRVHGRDVQNWLEAERIVMTRHEKGTKKEKPIKSSKTTIKKGK
jgi:Protein of unknown function (DUF2934)